MTFLSVLVDDNEGDSRFANLTHTLGTKWARFYFQTGIKCDHFIPKIPLVARPQINRSSENSQDGQAVVSRRVGALTGTRTNPVHTEMVS